MRSWNLAARGLDLAVVLHGRDGAQGVEGYDRPSTLALVEPNVELVAAHDPRGMSNLDIYLPGDDALIRVRDEEGRKRLKVTAGSYYRPVRVDWNGG
jgi:hypothetical protein